MGANESHDVLRTAASTVSPKLGGRSSGAGLGHQSAQSCSDWQAYEQRKRAFKRENPGASSAEYEAFIQALVQEMGL